MTPVGLVFIGSTIRSGRCRRSTSATLYTSPAHMLVCRSRAASSTFRGSMSSITMMLVQCAKRSTFMKSRRANSNRCTSVDEGEVERRAVAEVVTQWWPTAPQVPERVAAAPQVDDRIGAGEEVVARRPSRGAGSHFRATLILKSGSTAMLGTRERARLRPVVDADLEVVARSR